MTYDEVTDLLLFAEFYNPYTPSDVGAGWSYGFVIRYNDDGYIRVSLAAYESIALGVSWGWQVYWQVTSYDSTTNESTVIAEDPSHQVNHRSIRCGQGTLCFGRVNTNWAVENLDLGGVEAGRLASRLV